MAHVSLPHTISIVNSSKEPCHGKIKIDAIDMRFEDYAKSLINKPFWAQLPKTDVYLVYHGPGEAELLDAIQAAPYIDKYSAAPRNWWDYAEGTFGNERVKMAAERRPGEEPSCFPAVLSKV